MSSVSALQMELDDCRSTLELLSKLGSTVVYIFDHDRGTPVWVSADIRLLIGYEPDELQAMGEAVLAHFVHPDDIAVVQAIGARWPTTPDGAILEYQVRVRQRDGSYHWFEMREMVRTRHPDGRPHFVLGITSDIQGRRELADQSLRVAKLEALGRLAGGIAHDFNNLLTVVLGHVALAREAVDQGVDPSCHLDEIHRVADQAAGISRQILGFARAQATRLELVDPNQLVRDAAGMLQRLLDPCTLTVDLGAVWPIRIDRAQLAQVFLNLVTNARDAGGALRIETSRVDGEAGARVRLVFSDDGCGMRPEVLQQAFDPFFSTKARGGGAGLGLATVYGIVSQHQGTVTAVSAPDQGTRITIELPAVVSEGMPARSTTVAPTFRRTVPVAARIVIAEDEPMVAALTRRILMHAGHDVHVTHDGQAALEAIRARGAAVDLVISDIVMPRLGGIELTRILARERPELPVLLASGYPEDERRISDEVLAKTPCLPKPFRASELIDAVDAILAARAVGLG